MEDRLRGLLDPNPPLRSAAVWRALLDELVESLSGFLGVRFEVTSAYVHADAPGHASASNGVDMCSARLSGSKRAEP